MRVGVSDFDLILCVYKLTSYMFEFINYKGKQIFYIDYSQVKTATDTLNLLEKSADVLRNHSGKMLILINYKNAFASTEYMKRAKKISTETHHKVEKRALFGVTEIQKILIKTFNRFAKDKAYPFKTKEQALEFLVS